MKSEFSLPLIPMVFRSILLLSLLTAGFTRGGTSTIQFCLGTVDAPKDALGILVADTAGNGFHAVDDPSLIGVSLVAGNHLAGSDDVIVAVLQAEDGSHWNGGVGFAETIKYIDFAALGISGQTEMIFHVFPELLDPGNPIVEGAPFLSFRRDAVGNDGGTQGFVTTSETRSFSLSVVDSTAGGSTDFSNPAAGELFVSGNAGDPHEGVDGTPTNLGINGGFGTISGSMHQGDTDTFSFSIGSPKSVVIYTTGSTNTRGILKNSAGASLNDPEADKDAGDGENFSISTDLYAGIYKVVVSAEGVSNTGPYSLIVETVDLPSLAPLPPEAENALLISKTTKQIKKLKTKFKKLKKKGNTTKAKKLKKKVKKLTKFLKSL